MSPPVLQRGIRGLEGSEEGRREGEDSVPRQPLEEEVERGRNLKRKGWERRMCREKGAKRKGKRQASWGFRYRGSRASTEPTPKEEEEDAKNSKGGADSIG